MRTTLIVIALVASTGPAAAQGIYTADLLRDLPAGGNLFALIEAAQPEITTDRFNGGGLNGGAADKAGAFLASWSQTQYRIGDVPISSPVDGTPMLFPELAWWNKIDVATGLMPIRRQRHRARDLARADDRRQSLDGDVGDDRVGRLALAGGLP